MLCSRFFYKRFFGKAKVNVKDKTKVKSKVEFRAKLRSRILLGNFSYAGVYTLCLLLLTLSVSSCGLFSPRVESNTGGSAASREGSNLDIVNDVPIPSGAVLDNDRSLVLGRGSNWTGRLVFRVNRSSTSVFSLYQSEMPQFGWQIISVIQDEVGILQYVMGSRFATIRVAGSGFRGSRVSILMAPRTESGDSAPSSPGAPRAGSGQSSGAF